MQTLTLEVDNSLLDKAVDLLKNFVANEKKASFKILDNEEYIEYQNTKLFQENKATVEKRVEEYKNGETKLLDQNEYKEKMNTFLEDLKLQHAS
jgi:hypothetical protein